MNLSWIKKIFFYNLTTQILIGFILGLSTGLLYRYFPAAFQRVGISVTSFKVLGSLFINLIKMIIIPLIFISIISSVISVGDTKRTGSLALKSMVTFFVMTAIAVMVGIATALVAQPGKNVAFDKAAIMEQSLQGTADVKNSKYAKVQGLGEFLFNIVPSNIFQSFYDSDFLQIIFFATLFALAIIKSGNAAAPIIPMINSLSSIMLSLSNMIMRIAPLGIFGLTSWLFGTQDINLIKSLGFFVVLLYLACFFTMYVLYGLFALVILRLNPLHFYRKILPTQILGFLLASSSAALPLSLEIAEKKLGISKEKTNFIIPLGATVNMNGGAVYLGMCTVFIAQLFDVTLTPSDYAVLATLCTLGAIGTAPVPGASIFLLAGILSVMNLPLEAVAIILAIDRVLDMMRTFTNITGDVFSALIVDRIDGTFNEAAYITN